MFENPRRGRQARNFTTNAPKILDLKSSSEQIFSRKLPLGAPDSLSPLENCTRFQTKRQGKYKYSFLFNFPNMICLILHLSFVISKTCYGPENKFSFSKHCSLKPGGFVPSQEAPLLSVAPMARGRIRGMECSALSLKFHCSVIIF